MFREPCKREGVVHLQTPENQDGLMPCSSSFHLLLPHYTGLWLVLLPERNAIPVVKRVHGRGDFGIALERDTGRQIAWNSIGMDYNSRRQEEEQQVSTQLTLVSYCSKRERDRASQYTVCPSNFLILSHLHFYSGS